MDESKISLTKRLQAAGSWEQAALFKDSKIKELRSGGMSRRDAGEEGWRLMAAEYPPLEVDDPDPSGSFHLDAGDSQFVPAVEWVFDNMARDVTPDQAPSAGAWAMLRWVKSGNEDQFFKNILPRALELQVKMGSTADSEALEEVEECEALADLLGVAE